MNKKTTVFVIIGLLIANFMIVQTMALRGGVFESLDLLVDVRYEIMSEFVEVPNDKKMTDAAVRAMVASLGDPYTSYISPEEMAGFDKDVRGTFFGIGAEIDIHENFLRIVTPLEDSPAWKAGVLAGDIVLEIEGKSTEGITTGEAIKRLTGEENTKVKLKVRHLDGKVVDLEITRARIIVPTIKGVYRKADGHWDFILDPESKVGLVRITQFTDDTVPKLRLALDEVKAAGAKGLILDLRFDPGGLLTAAVDVSDMFLDGGKTIVAIRGRTQRERVYESRTQADDIRDLPMVVLVNESSASASEIVAGALKDNQRAIVIGTRSFGKGSVQQVKMLDSNQGALKITNALYYLPSGRNIHRKEDSEVWGVDPNDGFYVPMTTDEIVAMLKIRREAPQTERPAEVTPELIAKDWADPQLAAALKAINGRLAGGEWIKTGKNGTAVLAKQMEADRLHKLRNDLAARLEELDDKIKKLEGGEKGEPEKKAEPKKEVEPQK